jgi:hypothetical protein
MPWTYCRGRKVWRQAAVAPSLLQDEFVVPDPNPLSNPRICEPGPGTFNVVDLDARLSVNFGALTFAGASAVWDRTYLYSTMGFARRAGRYLEFEFTPQNLEYMRVGWQRASNGLIGDNDAMIYFGGGGFINVVDGIDPVSPFYPYAALTTSYRCRVYDTGAGYHYYVQEAPGTSWTLLWRKTNTNAPLFAIYPAIQNIGLQGTMQWFRIKNGALKPPVAFIAAPANNQTSCGAADGITEVALTVPAAGSPGLVFRQSDAANFWKLVLNRAGNQLELVKVVAGAATTVATSAFTWATGDTQLLRVVHFSDKLRCFLGNIAGPIATDSFNQTAAQIGTLADTTYLRLRCDTGGSLPA